MWLGSLIVLVGLWLVFGIFTLLACLRSAFKFTVQGLWTGLQDRVGLEAAVGIFFACAAVAGAVVFRWYLHRSSRLLAYSTDMPRSSARDSASSYMTHRDTVRASETPNPQQTVYPTPVGASVFGNTTGFMHDSLGVDGDRSRNRYSTMYCG
ncbi:guanylate-binding n-terminal domain-containing protein [Cystoisospora suis]|uniref:Guanylate-binding n-terminal domain-containing protein n=1 Tax=Cystoisospora suis TaxID=483139 RepID=A0A2C6LEI5_9APIC|nr:guanylate-binding n-terminal domain-containing protein [Cystoisospora suis]